jgi:ABC-type uncharacterized transport system involved in gliding motility auxiliary subunit
MKRAIPYLGSIAWGVLLAGVLLRMFQPDRERIWASFILVGLVLAIFYLGTRWRDLLALARKRGARYGANLGLMILLVAVIVAGINYLANRHNKRWDLTVSKQYTLSDQAVKILSNLDRDLNVIIFDRKDNAQVALDLLTEFGYHSKRISVEVVDQEAEPAKAGQYRTSTEANIPFGTIVIDAGDKVERVGVATEQELTNAIIKVIKEGKKKIYFVEGHGEKDIDDTGTGVSIIKTKLEESNYEVDKFHPLQSMKEGKIHLPEDATALVIAGPQRDYLPAEIDTLRSYLNEGGKVLFLIDPENQGAKPNLVALLEEFNLELGDNVVIDVSGVGQLFGFGPEVPLVASYSSHPITEKFANAPTVYPFVRTVESSDDSVEGVTVTTLVSSSPNSWAEQDFDDLAKGEVRPDEDERPGPLDLAAAVTIEVEEPKSEEDPGEEGPDGGEGGNDQQADDEEPEVTRQGRAVVVGDSDFITDGLVGAPVANLDLFVNMVNWIAEDEDLISIRPREPEDRRIFMNAQQQKNVFYLSLLIIPGLVLVAGISVWWGRR